MALSYVQYEGNGVQETFAVPFPYINKSHIEVRVALDVTGYTWDDPNTVRVSPAPAPGAVIEIRRITPRDVRMVDFVDASVLTESDLDLNSIQTFYIVQEAIDIAGGTLELLPDGSYGAGGRRIREVGTPVEPRDAVTKEYHEGTFVPQLAWLLDQATAAKNTSVSAKDTSVSARDAAIAARDLALQYRNDAYAYLTTTNNLYNQVSAWSANVDTKNDNVNAKSANVDAKNDNVNTKAAEAAASAESAYNWAERTSGPVTGSLYSSKYWAGQAATHAANAATFDPSFYALKAETFTKSETYTRGDVDWLVGQKIDKGAGITALHYNGGAGGGMYFMDNENGTWRKVWTEHNFDPANYSVAWHNHGNTYVVGNAWSPNQMLIGYNGSGAINVQVDATYMGVMMTNANLSSYVTMRMAGHTNISVANGSSSTATYVGAPWVMYGLTVGASTFRCYMCHGQYYINGTWHNFG